MLTERKQSLHIILGCFQVGGVHEFTSPSAFVCVVDEVRLFLGVLFKDLESGLVEAAIHGKNLGAVVDEIEEGALGVGWLAVLALHLMADGVELVQDQDDFEVGIVVSCGPVSLVNDSYWIFHRPHTQCLRRAELFWELEKHP